MRLARTRSSKWVCGRGWRNSARRTGSGREPAGPHYRNSLLGCSAWGPGIVPPVRRFTLQKHLGVGSFYTYLL